MFICFVSSIFHYFVLLFFLFFKITHQFCFYHHTALGTSTCSCNFYRMHFMVSLSVTVSCILTIFIPLFSSTILFISCSYLSSVLRLLDWIFCLPTFILSSPNTTITILSFPTTSPVCSARPFLMWRWSIFKQNL